MSIIAYELLIMVPKFMYLKKSHENKGKIKIWVNTEENLNAPNALYCPQMSKNQHTTKRRSAINKYKKDTTGKSPISKHL